MKNMELNNKKQVLIVGGGFGGVKCALTLSKDPNFKITLISKSNNLTYYPLQYQRATSLGRVNSLIPLDELFHNKNVKIISEEVLSIDKVKQTIQTASKKEYSYDFIVFSLGTVTNDFHIPGVKEYAFDIKNDQSIKKFKEHIHEQVAKNHHLDQNYFVIGAGPTGLELAGNLTSLVKEISKNHGVKQSHINLTIIEASPRLLANLPIDSSRIISRRLKKLKIKIKLKSKLEMITDHSIIVNQKEYPSTSVLWAAGSKNNPFFENNNFTITSRGKISVDAYLQTDRNIFVIGDNANTPYSGMAQTAIHDGEFVAKNLIRLINRKELKSYKVKKTISVIPIGHKWAAMIWGELRIYGYLGWLIRGIADLIGFHYLENWKQISKQYIYRNEFDEDCPVCKIAEDANLLN
jgi:NADH dehydrogenase